MAGKKLEPIHPGEILSEEFPGPLEIQKDKLGPRLKREVVELKRAG